MKYFWRVALKNKSTRISFFVQPNNLINLSIDSFIQYLEYISDGDPGTIHILQWSGIHLQADDCHIQCTIFH